MDGRGRCDICKGWLKLKACVACGALFHQSCVQPFVPDVSSRTCYKCTFQTDATCDTPIPRCHICLQTDGCMAKLKLPGTNVPESWVHIFCAISTPGLKPDTDGEEEDSLVYFTIREKELKVKEEVCCFCGVPGRFLVCCGSPGCERKMHTRCAQQAGTLKALNFFTESGSEVLCFRHHSTSYTKFTRANSKSKSSKKKRKSLVVPSETCKKGENLLLDNIHQGNVREDFTSANEERRRETSIATHNKLGTDNDEMRPDGQIVYRKETKELFTHMGMIVCRLRIKAPGIVERHSEDNDVLDPPIINNSTEYMCTACTTKIQQGEPSTKCTGCQAICHCSCLPIGTHSQWTCDGCCSPQRDELHCKFCKLGPSKFSLRSIDGTQYAHPLCLLSSRYSHADALVKSMGRPCVICNKQGGRLQPCMFKKDDFHCTCLFHPTCGFQCNTDGRTIQTRKPACVMCPFHCVVTVERLGLMLNPSQRQNNVGVTTSKFRPEIVKSNSNHDINQRMKIARVTGSQMTQTPPTPTEEIPRTVVSVDDIFPPEYQHVGPSAVIPVTLNLKVTRCDTTGMIFRGHLSHDIPFSTTAGKVLTPLSLLNFIRIGSMFSLRRVGTLVPQGQEIEAFPFFEANAKKLQKIELGAPVGFIIWDNETAYAPGRNFCEIDPMKTMLLIRIGSSAHMLAPNLFRSVVSPSTTCVFAAFVCPPMDRTKLNNWSAPPIDENELEAFNNYDSLFESKTDCTSNTSCSSDYLTTGSFDADLEKVELSEREQKVKSIVNVLENFMGPSDSISSDFSSGSQSELPSVSEEMMRICVSLRYSPKIQSGQTDMESTETAEETFSQTPPEILPVRKNRRKVIRCFPCSDEKRKRREPRKKVGPIPDGPKWYFQYMKQRRWMRSNITASYIRAWAEKIVEQKEQREQLTHEANKKSKKCKETIPRSDDSETLSVTSPTSEQQFNDQQSRQDVQTPEPTDILESKPDPEKERSKIKEETKSVSEEREKQPPNTISPKLETKPDTIEHVKPETSPIIPKDSGCRNNTGNVKQTKPPPDAEESTESDGVLKKLLNGHVKRGRSKTIELIRREDTDLKPRLLHMGDGRTSGLLKRPPVVPSTVDKTKQTQPTTADATQPSTSNKTGTPTTSMGQGTSPNRTNTTSTFGNQGGTTPAKSPIHPRATQSNLQSSPQKSQQQLITSYLIQSKAPDPQIKKEGVQPESTKVSGHRTDMNQGRDTSTESTSVGKGSFPLNEHHPNTEATQRQSATFNFQLTQTPPQSQHSYTGMEGKLPMSTHSPNLIKRESSVDNTRTPITTALPPINNPRKMEMPPINASGSEKRDHGTGKPKIDKERPAPDNKGSESDSKAVLNVPSSTDPTKAEKNVIFDIKTDIGCIAYNPTSATVGLSSSGPYPIPSKCNRTPGQQGQASGYANTQHNPSVLALATNAMRQGTPEDIRYTNISNSPKSQLISSPNHGGVGQGPMRTGRSEREREREMISAGMVANAGRIPRVSEVESFVAASRSRNEKHEINGDRNTIHDTPTIEPNPMGFTPNQVITSSTAGVPIEADHLTPTSAVQALNTNQQSDPFTPPSYAQFQLQQQQLLQKQLQNQLQPPLETYPQQEPANMTETLYKPPLSSILSPPPPPKRIHGNSSSSGSFIGNPSTYMSDSPSGKTNKRSDGTASANIVGRSNGNHGNMSGSGYMRGIPSDNGYGVFEIDPNETDMNVCYNIYMRQREREKQLREQQRQELLNRHQYPPCQQSPHSLFNNPQISSDPFAFPFLAPPVPQTSVSTAASTLAQKTPIRNDPNTSIYPEQGTAMGDEELAFGGRGIDNLCLTNWVNCGINEPASPQTGFLPLSRQQGHRQQTQTSMYANQTFNPVDSMINNSLMPMEVLTNVPTDSMRGRNRGVRSNIKNDIEEMNQSHENLALQLLSTQYPTTTATTTKTQKTTEQQLKEYTHHEADVNKKLDDIDKFLISMPILEQDRVQREASKPHASAPTPKLTQSDTTNQSKTQNIELTHPDAKGGTKTNDGPGNMLFPVVGANTKTDPNPETDKSSKTSKPNTSNYPAKAEMAKRSPYDPPNAQQYPTQDAYTAKHHHRSQANEIGIYTNTIEPPNDEGLDESAYDWLNIRRCIGTFNPSLPSDHIWIYTGMFYMSAFVMHQKFNSGPESKDPIRIALITVQSVASFINNYLQFNVNFAPFRGYNRVIFELLIRVTTKERKTLAEKLMRSVTHYRLLMNLSLLDHEHMMISSFNRLKAILGCDPIARIHSNPNTDIQKTNPIDIASLNGSFPDNTINHGMQFSDQLIITIVSEKPDEIRALNTSPRIKIITDSIKESRCSILYGGQRIISESVVVFIQLRFVPLVLTGNLILLSRDRKPIPLHLIPKVVLVFIYREIEDIKSILCSHEFKTFVVNPTTLHNYLGTTLSMVRRIEFNSISMESVYGTDILFDYSRLWLLNRYMIGKALVIICEDDKDRRNEIRSLILPLTRNICQREGKNNFSCEIVRFVDILTDPPGGVQSVANDCFPFNITDDEVRAYLNAHQNELYDPRTDMYCGHFLLSKILISYNINKLFPPPLFKHPAPPPGSILSPFVIYAIMVYFMKIPVNVIVVQYGETSFFHSGLISYIRGRDRTQIFRAILSVLEPLCPKIET